MAHSPNPPCSGYPENNMWRRVQFWISSISIFLYPLLTSSLLGHPRQSVLRHHQCMLLPSGERERFACWNRILLQTDNKSWSWGVIISKLITQYNLPLFLSTSRSFHGEEYASGVIFGRVPLSACVDWFTTRWLSSGMLLRSFIEIYRRFIGAYCLHHLPLRHYTMQRPRRRLSLHSPPWEPEISLRFPLNSV
jgi:hypothetical protein